MHQKMATSTKVLYSVSILNLKFSLRRCPDTNKPLGLMLLNGLTKLINEYKEVETIAILLLTLFSPLEL